jgi:hypothetical protein
MRFSYGGKIYYDLYQNKKITQQEAVFLYRFANNPSPGFLMTYLAVGELQHPELKWTILLFTLGTAFLYGILSSIFYQIPYQTSNPSDNNKLSPDFSAIKFISVLDDCIYSSTQNILRLGGYIVLFSILTAACIDFLPVNEHPVFLLAAASLELTNGLHMICRSSLPFSAVFLCCIGLSSFGGWSALVQSAGAAQMSPAIFLKYIKSRMIITLLSIIIVLCYFLCV